MRLIVLLQETNNPDEINNFFMKNCWHKIGDFCEAHEKSLNEMEDLKRFQGSTFGTIFRGEKLVQDRDTILELTGKIQELQFEINCMNDSRDCKDMNQYAVDNPTLPVNQRFSHLFQILADCSAVLWKCRAATMGHQVIWDTHGT